ncbi:MAG TPA: hypothetical protein VFT31_10890 [Kribbella sp.]|nr:hypothetical protein [Kribbella sp.]
MRAGLIRPDLADRDLADLTAKLTPGLAGYGAMIVPVRFLRRIRTSKQAG